MAVTTAGVAPGANMGPEMLTEIVDGVLVRQSVFCLSNAVVIRGPRGALLVDPGVERDDLIELARDLDDLGITVTAGFATHPHWDHVLWHRAFGDVPRYGTARCAAVARERRERLRAMTSRDAPGVDLESVAVITPMPVGSTHVPWDGPAVRVIEHQAHAPGHAALLIEGSGVLVAADMLSDVEIPLLDPHASDQCGAYLTALDLLEAACGGGVDMVVPGHGNVGRGPEIRSRIESDRSYVGALLGGVGRTDPRIGSDAGYGTDWLPQAHTDNVRLARATS